MLYLLLLSTTFTLNASHSYQLPSGIPDGSLVGIVITKAYQFLQQKRHYYIGFSAPAQQRQMRLSQYIDFEKAIVDPLARDPWPWYIDFPLRRIDWYNPWHCAGVILAFIAIRYGPGYIWNRQQRKRQEEQEQRIKLLEETVKELQASRNPTAAT